MSQEVKEPVRGVHVRMLCSCGGEFKPTGLCLLSSPPKFAHECTKCGASETFHREYPYYEFVETNKN